MRPPVRVPLEKLGPVRPTMRPVARAALLAALDTGPHAVCLFDPDDRLAYCNDAFRRDWAVEDLPGATFDTVIRNCHRTRRGAIVATDDIEAWLADARRKRRQGPADRAFEVDLWDGRWMWLSERRLEDGWLLFIAQDITALKRSERILRQAHDAAVEASLTDPLTRLPNRRHAMQVLEDGVAKGEPFHVALIDVDSFKGINDRFGHAAGDDVLVTLGGELAALVPRGCFVARLAGDEFLAMSAAHTLSAFEQVLLDLLRQRGVRCAASGASQIFGISLGVAGFPDHGMDVRQVLSAADAAMYRAKSRGRCTLQLA